jgi:hypothetical protein
MCYVSTTRWRYGLILPDWCLLFHGGIEMRAEYDILSITYLLFSTECQNHYSNHECVRLHRHDVTDTLMIFSTTSR